MTDKVNILEAEKEISPKSKGETAESRKILIVGGYGQVGLSIAKRLAPLFPGQITIAGRNLSEAEDSATKIGHKVEARLIDIFKTELADVLDDVVLVVVCIDQSDTRFVEQCLSRGVHYVDISAKDAFLSRVEALDNLAKQFGATAMLSVCGRFRDHCCQPCQPPNRQRLRRGCRKRCAASGLAVATTDCRFLGATL